MNHCPHKEFHKWSDLTSVSYTSNIFVQKRYCKDCGYGEIHTIVLDKKRIKDNNKD